MVEYAFIFLFVMAVLLGIMDFSRALYDYHFVSNAARDATRWAAVNGLTCASDGSCNGTGGMNNGPASPSDIQAYVANRIPMGIDPNRLMTTVNYPTVTPEPSICTTYPTAPGCNCYTLATENSPGCTVAVQVSYQFNFLFPLVHISPINLSSTSRLVIVH
jgi:Flp pilus assembly protein TadG